MGRTESGSFLSVDPITLERLVRGIEKAVTSLQPGANGSGPVLLSSQSLRSSLQQIMSRIVPRLAVLSHNELPPDIRVVAQEIVSLADAH